MHHLWQKGDYEISTDPMTESCMTWLQYELCITKCIKINCKNSSRYKISLT